MAVSIRPTFVVDASFVITFLFPDEPSEHINALFDQLAEEKIEFISTQLLPFEIANSLYIAIRRKRFNPRVAYKIMDSFFKLDIKLEEVNIQEVLRLSFQREITAYDSSYITLAKQRKVPLLTLDKKLEKLERFPRKKTN